MTKAEITAVRRAAEAAIHPDKMGMSEALLGPFRCHCVQCAHNWKIVSVCDIALTAKGDA